MTAGHCTSFNEVWNTKIVPWGALHTIGPAHNKIFPYYADVAIIRAETPSYWQQSPLPGPRVAVDYSGGTAYDPMYYIGGEANIVH